ncbi:hypothetical protein D3C73_1320090 [compost metagenome]
MTTVVQLALSNAVTVRQQERIAGFIGDNFSGKPCQHVRTVEIPGNMAETFRFALRAQRFAGLIQAFQCGIRRRTDFIHDAQRKTFRQVADDQRPLFFFILCPRFVVHVD